MEYRLCVVQATEDFIVHLLEDCNLCAIHAKRVTISKRLFQAAGTTSLQQRSAQHAPSAFMFAASCTTLLHHAHLCCIMHTFVASCTPLLHYAHLCCIMHIFASGTPLLYHAGRSVCDGTVSLNFHCSAKGHAAGKENQRSNCWCFVLLSLNKQDFPDTLK